MFNVEGWQTRAGRSAARLWELCSIATPDTLLGWYQSLIAKKYDGSAKRPRARPRKAADIRELILRIAKETWLPRDLA